MLEQLPVELLEFIITELSLRDIISLRQTCHTLNSFVSPRIFKSLEIEFPKHHGFLAAVAQNSFIALFVRSLDLISSRQPNEIFSSMRQAQSWTDTFGGPGDLPSESGSSTSSESPGPSSHIDILRSESPIECVPFIDRTGALSEPPSSYKPAVFPITFTPGSSFKRGKIGSNYKRVAPRVVSFVRQLQNVQKINWNYRSSPLGNSYVGPASLALAEIANLKEFNLKITSYDPKASLPDLSKFKDLTLLHIAHETSCGAGVHLLNNVMPAVGRSPMLTTFGLTVDDNGCETSLDSLVHDSNIWCTTPTTLLDLKLLGVPVQLDSRVRRVFQNLKHLTLGAGDLGAEDLRSQHGSLLSPYKDPEFMELIAWKKIWDALYEAGCNEGMWLETLTTEGGQPPSGLNALFNYLQSHPELKELSIQRPWYIPKSSWRFNGTAWVVCTDSMFDSSTQTPGEITETDSARAMRFWCNVLPGLGQSLRVLSIISMREGPWCYGPGASSAIRQCNLLEKLEIAVSAVDVKWAQAKAASLEITTLPVDDPETLEDTGDTNDTNTRVHFICEQQRPRWQEEVFTGPIPWGKMESAPVLLAADLGECPRLREAEFYCAEPAFHGTYCGVAGVWGNYLVSDPSRWSAERFLERFVPWEGYPHKLVGGIFHARTGRGPRW